MYQNILRLEGVMAVLVLCGAALRRSKVITDEGQDCLTDLLTDLILPCNIFLSFPGQTDLETLHSFLITILISVLVMLGTAGLGKAVYRRCEERTAKVFQYGLVNSNAMFIGLPVVQSLLGSQGVMQLTMYMIFVRMFCWSYGLSLYTGVRADWRTSARRLLLHPCMLAAVLGLLAMLTGLRLPLPPREAVDRAWRQALDALEAKLVVLDDDPTGIQTVHDVAVYTDWEEETLRRALEEEGRMFFVLTNSRSFSQAETVRVHREIARNLSAAARTTGRSFLLLSRGDSTLRGHYPLETQTLREELERQGPVRYDGEILMPYFQEGGRITVGDVHYVRMGGRLVPAGETEFARDTTFAFHASDLKQWCQEKTHGAYPASQVLSIPLEQLRRCDYEGIADTLCRARDFQKIVVNGADDLDAEVFVTGLVLALARGKHFLFRCAAGLVVVGSHVDKSTRQLEYLLRELPGLCPICLQARRVLEPGGLEAETRRVREEAERAILAGTTAVVFTSRTVLRASSDSVGDNLELSVRIAGAVTGLVGALSLRPRFLVAKGGITSSEIGVRALGVRRAWVLGQIAPGVPVWQTGPESRFPGLPYVIFPGNVGEDSTLFDVVRRLTSAGRG